MDEKQLKDEQELAKVLAGINSTDQKVTQVDDSDPEDLLKSFNTQGAPKPIVKDNADSDNFELPDFESSAMPNLTAPTEPKSDSKVKPAISQAKPSMASTPVSSQNNPQSNPQIPAPTFTSPTPPNNMAQVQQPAPTPGFKSIPNPNPLTMNSVFANPSVTPAQKSNLDAIKKNVINDLKPLVGELDLPDDERFDTYLLLIRSTDDDSLIAPAYEVAKKIADTKKRAKALLDVVKEINYFNSTKK